MNIYIYICTIYMCVYMFASFRTYIRGLHVGLRCVAQRSAHSQKCNRKACSFPQWGWPLETNMEWQNMLYLAFLRLFACPCLPCVSVLACKRGSREPRCPLKGLRPSLSFVGYAPSLILVCAVPSLLSSSCRNPCIPPNVWSVPTAMLNMHVRN